MNKAAWSAPRVTLGGALVRDDLLHDGLWLRRDGRVGQLAGLKEWPGKYKACRRVRR